MPVYNVGIIAYSQMTVNSGTPFANGTVSSTGSFTVQSGATPITLQINDDDLNFEDGYIETGSAQTLAAAVTINGTTYPVGTTVEYEYRMNMTTGEQFAVVRLGNQNVGLAGSGNSLPEPGTSYTIGSSTDGNATPYDAIPCFAAGTLIDTVDGPRAIETLVEGDLVLTRDNGPQPIRWIGATTLTVDELSAQPHLRPVRIHKGALGNTRDLVVSPQHCILIDDWRAELHFGIDTVLIPAKALVNGATVTQESGDQPVTYLHLYFDTHQIVCSEGVHSESLFPGAFITGTGQNEAMRELLELFPALADLASYGPPAYPVMRQTLASAVA